MFARPALLVSIIQAALLLSSVEARTWLLERDGRAIFARRFGQAQPAVLKEIAAACGGGICDALADEAVSCIPYATHLPAVDALFLPGHLDCSAVGCPTGMLAARHGR